MFAVFIVGNSWGPQLRRISPVLLILLLVLSGCGSSSGGSEPDTSAFKTAFAAQKKTLSALGKDVGAAVEGANQLNDAELVKQFEGLATRATTLAGTLAQLEVPKKFKVELSELQSSLTQVAGTLHSIEAAAAAHDAVAAKVGGEAIVVNARQVKTVDDRLSARLGLPSSP